MPLLSQPSGSRGGGRALWVQGRPGLPAVLVDSVSLTVSLLVLFSSVSFSVLLLGAPVGNWFFVVCIFVCMCVYTCVHICGGLVSSSVAFQFLRQALTEPSLPLSAIKPKGSSCLYLPPKCWDCRCTLPGLAFYLDAGVCSAWPYHLSRLPSLQNSLFVLFLGLTTYSSK